MNDLKVVLRRLIKHPRFADAAVLLLVFGAAMLNNSCAACAAISGSAFDGLKAGDEIVVSVVALCWCPPGKFNMGSPRNEPERRPDEDQVEVTLTKGFWMGKFEATKGQWKLICTVISSNGAGIGIAPNCPAGLIRICISQRLRPACAEAVAGRMTVGPVDRLSGCGLNPNVATTTSASESQPSNENKQVPLSS